MKTEIKYDKEIETFHLPRWNELPNVDLYLDQVVTLLENYLSDYIKEESEKEGKFITKTPLSSTVATLTVAF